jgi:hypothetical protein
LKYARQYDLILTGSIFNQKILQEKYHLNNVATAWQGVDVTRFRPLLDSESARDDFNEGGSTAAASSVPSGSKSLAGKFVVFSGGKMEMRKGQDIVVAAFARFIADGEHEDAVLMTAWHNQWPKLVSTIADMGIVKGAVFALVLALHDTLRAQKRRAALLLH